MSPTQYAQFADAARRHLDDALHLYAQNRFANADHIAGFAAECGLKAILIDYLGGILTSSGRPKHHTKPPGHRYGHLPDLWAARTNIFRESTPDCERSSGLSPRKRRCG